MIENFNFFVVVIDITTDGKFLAAHVQKHNSSNNILHLYNKDQIINIGDLSIKTMAVNVFKTKKQATEACNMLNDIYRKQGRYIYDIRREAE